MCTSNFDVKYISLINLNSDKNKEFEMSIKIF